jgi:hypothetical protein
MFAPRAGADQVDPQSIRPEDLQEWKRALEEQVQAATRALNELRMYESIGCGAGRQQELANARRQQAHCARLRFPCGNPVVKPDKS